MPARRQAIIWTNDGLVYQRIYASLGLKELEHLERLRSEDTPRRPMITHTIDQFILNPKSIPLTSSYQIPSQNKVKAEKLAKNWNFRILF